MKNWLSKKSNIFILLVFAFVIWRNAPNWIAGFEKQGEVITTENYLVLNAPTPEKRPFPPTGSKAIAIFWASWCGPCKLEMERLSTSVKNGQIPVGAIYAINAFESEMAARKFVSENNYPFTFMYAPDLVKKLDIVATPTTLYVEDNRILSLKTGLSIFGIWKAESFL